jgi:ribosomal peptide maturation radical SAM protein 1
MDYLVARYGVRNLYSVDAILDLKYFDTVIRELASRPRPPRLFYETKSNLTKAQLKLLARAGVRFLQPGIESLSTPILKLMDKGVTGLQNVRTLKWCAEIGIQPEWNCLYGFPDEDPVDYSALADQVPSLTHLQPPAGGGEIRLDRFSPYFNEAPHNGMINPRATIAYRHIYPFPPAELDRLAYYFDHDYADGRDPAAYTERLRAEIAVWRSSAKTARLELRDDGDAIEIRDTRPAAVAEVTVLRGAERVAYLALDAGSTVSALQDELRNTLGPNSPDADALQGFLDDWLKRRLVLFEGNRYLSLAVNVDGRVKLPVELFLEGLMGSPA